MPNENSTSKEAIEDFLRQARKAVADRNYSHFSRKKFMYLCAKLGKMLDDDKIFDVINKLDYTNYFRSPTADHDLTKTDFVWEFKSSIGSIKIYIKVKILEFDGRKLHCFGFHEDEM